MNDPEFAHFDDFGPNEPLARAAVNRAISDWESVIESFNYAEDSDADPNNDLDDTFEISFSARNLAEESRGFTLGSSFEFNSEGKPTGATIELDAEGSSQGWFFDATPFDDAEFSSIAGEFAASRIDAAPSGGQGTVDFYMVALHEIGHALGYSVGIEGSAIDSMVTRLVDDNGDIYRWGGLPLAGASPLTYFESTRPNPEFGVNAVILEIGGHLYEGSDVYMAEQEHAQPPFLEFQEDPDQLFLEGTTTQVAFTSHPNSVMNQGETFIVGVSEPSNETNRRLVGDLEAMILADAYGYSVNLPSQFDTMHVTLDHQTGTLLVQGLPDASNETITVEPDGSDLKVVVGNANLHFGNATERVPSADVHKIVIVNNGGGYNISVDSAVVQPWQQVDYVVSSNCDADASASSQSGPGMLDLDPIVPGNQVTLRAAVQDAQGTSGSGAGSVYVPRGDYVLYINGGGGVEAGDLNITGDVTVVGSGAGTSVIETYMQNANRHFDVESTGSLRLERLTLTGGTTFPDGGSIRVAPGNSAAAALVLEDSAVTYNGTMYDGGAIYVGAGSTAEITRSVITNDMADNGGGIYADGDSANGAATVHLTDSIVAKNSATTADPDLASGGSGANRGQFTSGGHNLIGDVGGANFSQAGTDHVDADGDVSHVLVVTSVVDEFDATNNDRAMSIRDAVLEANDAQKPFDEIWLPAWHYRLTRESIDPGAFDDALDYGDLEITQSVTFHGAGDKLVSLEQTVERYQDFDAVFDLLGDYNGDGYSGEAGGVTGGDHLKWQGQFGMTGDPGEVGADGNDDGVVDAADEDIWESYFGNWFKLDGFDEA